MTDNDTTRIIRIFDTTLRDGEQAPGCSMNPQEKLEVARRLEKLGVDIMEAGFPASSPGDLESVKTIAGIIKDCTVAGLCRCVEKDIDAGREALAKAAHPRIHVFLATSPIHMEPGSGGGTGRRGGPLRPEVLFRRGIFRRGRLPQRS